MKRTAAIALITLAALLLLVLSVQPRLNSREASRPGGGVGTSGDADQRSAASAKSAVEQAPEVAAPVHPPQQLVELNVYPREINLTTRRDFQSLVVQARFDDGVTRDVTHDSTFVFAEPTLVDFDEQVVHPLLDGETTLTVTYGDQTVESSVTVKNAQVDRPISFKLDVMPVFARAGCNTGSCHGSARGQDGFHLSLFGYDPNGDYQRLTRQLADRRINLAMPQESLVIEKALGRVPHTGGTRFTQDTPYYETLIRWLDAGVPRDSDDVAKVVAVDVMPPFVVLQGKGARQRMTVRAKYSDGTDRDVTALAVFLTNNDMSAKVDNVGVITAGQRGEAFVMARFDTHAVGSHIIVIPADADTTPADMPNRNYIDDLVNNKLRKLRITPSPRCSDEVFVRRAYLDICGVLPTGEEYEQYMADESPDRRDKLIDELLDRKEFVELWVMKWAELLQVRSGEISYKAMLLYYNWLQDRIANNVPMNEIVNELLSSAGGTFKTPATNYYQLQRETLKVSENVAQVFVGARIQCAQCHNHPFDRWTMDDYYSFAAFFSQIGRKQAEDIRETIVFDSGSGEVEHPVGGRVMPPKFLGADTPADLQGRGRRKAVADWLTASDNPYFSRNLVNIMWAHFFGRGIIEPVDDVRVSNPASNPQLLDALATRFVEYDYDLRTLVRDLCTSEAYQRSTQTTQSNAGDVRNFSHGSIRRLRAEIVLDAISQVSHTKNKFKGLPLGARAVQISDGAVSDYFLTTFGRATRQTVCSCEVKMEPNLSQALHLLNGPTVHQKIQEGGLVKRLLNEGETPQQIIDRLYVTCLTRHPTSAENARVLELVSAQEDKHKALNDVFWAVLNSKEFIFNH
ncbi:MAG: cell surface protein [Phycisphaerae bacterium]|nr:cell surface protein [Phycisphaerae bacterium]